MALSPQLHTPSDSITPSTDPPNPVRCGLSVASFQCAEAYAVPPDPSTSVCCVSTARASVQTPSSFTSFPCFSLSPLLGVTNLVVLFISQNPQALPAASGGGGSTQLFCRPNAVWSSSMVPPHRSPIPSVSPASFFMLVPSLRWRPSLRAPRRRTAKSRKSVQSFQQLRPLVSLHSAFSTWRTDKRKWLTRQKGANERMNE